MDIDVIVVGAGPSGLLTAAELALSGARVQIVERRPQPSGSRAGTILPRVLELFDARGLAQEFIERARSIRSNPLIPYHIWGGMAPVFWSHLRSPFGYRLILPQNVTEELLARHAERLGLRIDRGITVTELEQDDAGVRLLGVRADGSSWSGAARYVVGADGGRSAVRTLLGIDWEGHDATFTGIVADAVVDYPFDAARHSRSNQHGWAAAFPFENEGPVTRFTIVHAERRHASRDKPVTAAEVRTCIADILGKDLPIRELRFASRYTDELRLASRFRHGRVLLVGESTRVHYPASGVGMNFCLQDAMNLGWKLGAVLAGHATEQLLDTYETERRPVTEQLLSSVATQCAVQFDFSANGIAHTAFFERHLMPLPQVNEMLGRDLNGLVVDYHREGEHPLDGRTVPDLTLQTRGGLVRVAELLRDQCFVLIDASGDGCYDELKVGDLPVRVVTGVPLSRPEGLERVRTMLVRPDSYFAWVDEGPADPDRALAEIGRLLAWPA